MASTRAWAALSCGLALTLASCTKPAKPKPRTEPWPAPAPSASAAAPLTGETVRYRIDRAKVDVLLRAGKKSISGTLGGVEGTIELKPASLEQSRAELRADLLTLTLGTTPGSADPALLARAFDWLELTGSLDRATRERHRYAQVRIQTLQRSQDAGSDQDARVVAYGDVTFHRFRVPASLELDVSFDTAGGAGLSIRTRRPLVVQLAAHDVLPRDSNGKLVAADLVKLGREVGREVQLSVELHALPETPTPAPSPSSAP